LIIGDWVLANDIEWHLAMLRVRPRDSLHLTNLLISLWRSEQSYVYWIILYNCMSSAKQSRRLWCNTDWAQLTKREKRKGERWPPWGTPEVAIKGSDLTPNNFTHWGLFVKKDSNQDRRGSPKPEDRSMWRRTIWLTASNALEKSVYITSTWAPISIELNV